MNRSLLIITTDNYIDNNLQFNIYGHIATFGGELINLSDNERLRINICTKSVVIYNKDYSHIIRQFDPETLLAVHPLWKLDNDSIISDDIELLYSSYEKPKDLYVTYHNFGIYFVNYIAYRYSPRSASNNDIRREHAVNFSIYHEAMNNTDLFIVKNSYNSGRNIKNTLYRMLS